MFNTSKLLDVRNACDEVLKLCRPAEPTIRVTNQQELLAYLAHVCNYGVAEEGDEFYVAPEDAATAHGLTAAQIGHFPVGGSFDFWAPNHMPECWFVDLEDPRLRNLKGWDAATECGLYFVDDLLILVVANSDHGGGFIPNYLYGRRF